MSHTRKILLMPFGAVAAALVLTSAAYACTVFRGTFTVTGDRGGTVTSTGLRTGMVESVTASKAFASASGGWVRVSTGTDGCCNRLPDKDSTGALRNYQVNFFNGEGYDTHGHWFTDCMAGDAGVTLAQVRLNTQGQIAQMLVSGAYRAVAQPVQLGLGSGLTRNVGAQESAVCISDSSGLYGNQAPVTIV
jgi:hypothetical protein